MCVRVDKAVTVGRFLDLCITTPSVPNLRHARHGQQHEAIEEAVVLKMNVVDEKEAKAEKDERSFGRTRLALGHPPRPAVGRRV